MQQLELFGLLVAPSRLICRDAAATNIAPLALKSIEARRGFDQEQGGTNGRTRSGGSGACEALPSTATA